MSNWKDAYEAKFQQLDAITKEALKRIAKETAPRTARVGISMGEATQHMKEAAKVTPGLRHIIEGWDSLWEGYDIGQSNVKLLKAQKNALMAKMAESHLEVIGPNSLSRGPHMTPDFITPATA